MYLKAGRRKTASSYLNNSCVTLKMRIDKQRISLSRIKSESGCGKGKRNEIA